MTTPNQNVRFVEVGEVIPEDALCSNKYQIEIPIGHTCDRPNTYITRTPRPDRSLVNESKEPTPQAGKTDAYQGFVRWMRNYGIKFSEWEFFIFHLKMNFVPREEHEREIQKLKVSTQMQASAFTRERLEREERDKEIAELRDEANGLAYTLGIRNGELFQSNEKLTRAQDALREIQKCTGTSTEAWNIATAALEDKK